MANLFDVDGFNIALNEAKLLNVEFDSTVRSAYISLNALSLPVDRFPSDDSFVEISLQFVNNFIVIYKMGRWDDPKAEIKRLDRESLSEIVQSFGGLPIYGDDFLQHTKNVEKIIFNDVSFEYHNDDASNFKLWLFQASNDRYLEFHIWFNDLEIKNSENAVMPVEEFIAGGKRFWEGVYNNDFRVQGYGIYPLNDKNNENDKSK